MKTAFIKRIPDFILNIFYPTRCPYCLKVISSDSECCESCEKLMPEIIYKRYAIGGYPCCTVFPYMGIFSSAVKQLKFYKKADFAKQLAAPLARAVKDFYDISEFDIVTCVPMHKKQLKKRKYNQAALLAKECAKLLDLPYEEILEKRKQNQAQHKTRNRKEREKNVRGVFGLTEKNVAKGRSVLIIDDIITTGCTLGECARVLQKGKAKKICCATLCTSVIGENNYT